MSKKDSVETLLLSEKLLPLFYSDDVDVSKNVLRALYHGGVRILEYTNRGDHALKNFAQLRSLTDAELPGLQLGIGTIKTASQAGSFIEAGADFIVAPNINPEVGELTHKAGLLWIPGCMTPTEVSVAEASGAGIVKIFPGNILGPAYISSIKELFSKLKFIVTGGVEPEANNLSEWFKSGVVGVGMGSKLITKDIIANNDYKKLTSDTMNTLQLIKAH